MKPRLAGKIQYCRPDGLASPCAVRLDGDVIKLSDENSEFVRCPAAALFVSSVPAIMAG